MAYERFALVVDDDDGALGPLSLHLLRMGIDALYTNQGDEGSLLATQESKRIGVLLLPLTMEHGQIAKTVRETAVRAGLKSESVIMVGPNPDVKMRVGLRGLGVRWWIELDADPVTQRSLVTFVMSSDDDLDSRIEPRVPALLLAEVDTGTGTVDARVRNLSVGGAFLELDDAIDPEAELKVAIALDDERLEVGARVAFQVPADRDRPEGVPSGAGICFGELDLAAEAVLRRFLAELVGRYQL